MIIFPQSVFFFHDFFLFHLLFSSLFFASLFSSLLFFSLLLSCLSSYMSPSPLSSLVSFSSFLFLFLFLSFVFSFLSLSSFSVCWWCVCRRVCHRACLCVWCGVVWCGVVWCAVWCGTLKTPCVDSKTPPCADSKRLRVCPQHAHMLFSMCAWCRYTRGRFECTHGDRFKSTHGGRRQFSLPKNHARMVITCFRGSPKKLLDLSHFQV